MLDEVHGLISPLGFNQNTQDRDLSTPFLSQTMVIINFHLAPTGLSYLTCCLREIHPSLTSWTGLEWGHYLHSLIHPASVSVLRSLAAAYVVRATDFAWLGFHLGRARVL